MLPSAVTNGSAPAIFRISWLNPTPHTIAVYASPLPSPTDAQHSLAGGRYPLPAPDFHRLDRASFAGALFLPGNRAKRALLAPARQDNAFCLNRFRKGFNVSRQKRPGTFFSLIGEITGVPRSAARGLRLHARNSMEKPLQMALSLFGHCNVVDLRPGLVD
jgi:hypothetical protein